MEIKLAYNFVRGYRANALSIVAWRINRHVGAYAGSGGTALCGRYKYQVMIQSNFKMKFARPELISDAYLVSSRATDGIFNI